MSGTEGQELPFDPTKTYKSEYPLPKPLAAHQPFKLLWGTAALLANLAQLPLWIVVYLLPRFRPNPKWSLQNAVMNHIVARNLYHLGAVRAVTPLSLEPGREGKRWEIAHPSRKNVYIGRAVDERGVVKPVPVPGTWTPAKPSPGKANKRTILHFHGGAFIIGDARDLYSGNIGKVLTKGEAAPQVIAAGYRLASNPDGYFPAQLQDAITWWFYLVDTLGISPQNIILSGDSAGANLAYQLLRYIELNRELFPVLPGALLLWSPWVDLVSGFHQEEVAKVPNYKTDYIVPNFPGWGASHMAINLPATDPWLSPVRGVFVTDVPTFIQTGDSEILFDDIQLFYKKVIAATGDNGKRNKVEIHVSPNANHDIILLSHLMGFGKEIRAAVAHSKKFLDENMKA